jgi:hypothetical protein
MIGNGSGARPLRFCFNGQLGAPLSVRASETAVRPASALVVFVIGVAAFSPQRAMADEGGVSFWVPGQYGSFAAIAPSPGWSLPLVYYNYGGSKGAARILPNGQLSAGIGGSFDGLFLVPTYTVGATIFGAVPSFSMTFIPAYSAASANVRAAPLSLSRSDTIWGGSDLYPTAQLFWNRGGVNNFMAYLAGDIPAPATIPTGWPISESAMARPTLAARIPISIRNPEASSSRPTASPATLPTRRRIARTGSTRISISRRRNS